MTSTLLIGMGIGGPVGGWVSDRLKLRRPVLLGAAFVTLLSIAPVIWLDGLPISLAYALLFVFGAANGSMVVIFATASESNEPRYVGTASALCNTAIMGCGALMQQGIGVLLDLFWTGGLTAEGARFYDLATYREAFLFYPLASAIAIWAAWSTRETHARNPHVSGRQAR
jgi:MFS family permease